MLKHNYDLSGNFLTSKDYTTETDSDINLTEHIISYYDGDKWKIIPIDLISKYHVIHDTYYENKMDTKTESKQDITLLMCPFTYITVVLEGIYYPSDYTLNGCIMLQDASGELISVLDNSYYNDNTKKINKHMAYIKTFRNAISEHPDCLFIHTNKKTKSNVTLSIHDNYDINPLTLVRVIDYISSDGLIKKYTVVVGKDKMVNEITGYDMEKSGFNKYIDSVKDKIIEKNGFIYPCLWYAVNSLFPTAKILYL